MIPEPEWSPSLREYHATRERWSPSMLKVFRESPREAFLRFVAAPERPDGGNDWSQSRRIGAAVNALVLDPDVARSLIHTVEAKRRGAAAVGDAQRAFPDRLVLTRPETDLASGVADAILEPGTRAAEVANAILTAPGGYSEWAYRWEDAETGVRCKLMVDRLAEVYGRPTIGELKTSRNPSPREFRRDARRFGYGLQAAHNVAGVEDALGEKPQFFWVVVRNAPPFEVAVWRSSRLLLEGRDDRREALRRLARCTDDEEDGRLWRQPWELLEDDEIPEI